MADMQRIWRVSRGEPMANRAIAANRFPGPSADLAVSQSAMVMAAGAITKSLRE
ncbi:MAG: hypothetical protein QOD10_2301 [Mycobacterium sp.]|jgi:hypothetical protein|nr:hypothetical protein [Mycobacterium sp.]